jgi:hypothetical protein
MLSGRCTGSSACPFRSPRHSLQQHAGRSMLRCACCVEVDIVKSLVLVEALCAACCAEQACAVRSCTGALMWPCPMTVRCVPYMAAVSTPTSLALEGIEMDGYGCSDMALRIQDDELWSDGPALAVVLECNVGARWLRSTKTFCVARPGRWRGWQEFVACVPMPRSFACIAHCWTPRGG